MKKLFAMLLAIAMIASFALVASADETETYTASLIYWDGHMDDMALPGQVTTTISGSGTYTLTYDASVSTSGAWGAVFLYVQIDDAYDALKDWILSDVSVTVDGTDWPVNQNVAHVDPFEDLGRDYVPDASIYVYYGTTAEQTATNNYIIELANTYAGFTKFTEEPVDNTSWTAFESITVTFTLTDPDDVVEEPTDEPTEEPTEEPSEEPTEAPTEEPTEKPSADPTEEPTEAPTEAPVPDDSNAKTGDALSVIVALMAVSAVGIAVASKKKLF